MRRPKWLSPGVSLALQVAAFWVFGSLLLLVAADHTTRSAEFRDTPRFLVWAVIIAAQTATWPILFRVGRDQLREVTPYVRGRRTLWEAARVLALFVVIAVFWLTPQLSDDRPDEGLWGHPVRMGIATLGGLIAATPCLLTMWRTHDALAPSVSDRESALDMMRRLDVLRHAFTVALAAVGVLVTEATLASGALRNALIEWDPGVADRFPAEYVLLYGAFFTALLAAAAVPTYGRLHRQATAVVDQLLPPLPPVEGKPWQQRLSKRRDLAGVVQADSGVMQNFQATVLVAGPLLPGLISLLLPTNS